ncbi:MAG: translation initiation factor IF-2 subunit beta [Candidatus Diapherotrites archaeon]|nr:translation initiation factor IF-2 subunit beta [Candidatus Diapherotrites archaeon]
MDYDQLLQKAYTQLPEKQKETVRLEIPRPDSMIQGKKTIIKNFGAFMKTVRREEAHLMKYLTRETGAPATATEGRLTIGGKFGFMQINKLFDAYLNEFVFCKECRKPDTKFIDQGRLKSLQCEACGAIAPIKRL